MSVKSLLFLRKRLNSFIVSRDSLEIMRYSIRFSRHNRLTIIGKHLVVGRKL